MGARCLCFVLLSVRVCLCIVLIRRSFPHELKKIWRKEKKVNEELHRSASILLPINSLKMGKINT